MKNNLQTVYSYFSHHMRNCTAMIATSVTLLSHKMSNDEERLFNEVIESSFLLDLFDRGMHICFQEVFEDTTEYTDTLNLEQAVLHFVVQCKSLMEEKGVKLNLHVGSPAMISGQVHEIRTLTNIIMYELINQTHVILTGKLINKKLTVTADGQVVVPEIWALFKQILGKHNVRFEYIKNRCVLEFNV